MAVSRAVLCSSSIDQQPATCSNACGPRGHVNQRPCHPAFHDPRAIRRGSAGEGIQCRLKCQTWLWKGLLKNKVKESSPHKTVFYSLYCPFTTCTFTDPRGEATVLRRVPHVASNATKRHFPHTTSAPYSK